VPDDASTMVPRTPNNATPLLLDYGRVFMNFYMTPGSCSTSIHIILEELEEVFEVYIMNLLAGDPA
jgi:hypothetical protein